MAPAATFTMKIQTVTEGASTAPTTGNRAPRNWMMGNCGYNRVSSEADTWATYLGNPRAAHSSGQVESRKLSSCMSQAAARSPGSRSSGLGAETQGGCRQQLGPEAEEAHMGGSKLHGRCSCYYYGRTEMAINNAP